MVDKVDDKSFLQRWSARKLDAERATMETEVAVTADTADEFVETSPSDPPPPPPADLPDVETLDASSDYTGFLGEHVPEDLAKMALRKLWRSDPVLANIDGLNDYDTDYSKVGMVSEAVKTVYQAGKGYLSGDETAEGVSGNDEVGEEEVALNSKGEHELNENADTFEGENDSASTNGDVDEQDATGKVQDA